MAQDKLAGNQELIVVQDRDTYNLEKMMVIQFATKFSDFKGKRSKHHGFQ